MKMRVIQYGDKTFDLDAEYAGPAIREAISGESGEDVRSEIIDYTDTERSNISYDQYAIVTEDDGTEKWRGWLGMGRENIPAPDALVRDQLEIATAALRRLSLIDEMAGMGQRDGDPELTARCRHAAVALERIGQRGPIPGKSLREEIAELADAWAEDDAKPGNLTRDEYTEQHVYRECAKSLRSLLSSGDAPAGASGDSPVSAPSSQVRSFVGEYGQ